MRRRKKQRPGDEQLLHDESGDSVERASAMMRLAADGRKDLIPVAKSWLGHPDVELRWRAVSMLVGFWSLEDMVPATIQHLHHDPEPDIRCVAASVLCDFVEEHRSQEDDILSEVVAQLEREDDPIAQMALYETLVEHLIPLSERPKVPFPFNRDTDVDWDLLARWRRH